MRKVKEVFRYLFLPHEKNNQRARVLHHDFLTFYLVAAVGLVFLTKVFSSSFTNVLGFATDITTEKLYQLTNEERKDSGLSPLVLNDKLSEAAYQKAQDMFTKDYWAHYAPDGTTPWNFILSSGYQYEYAGENLAKNFLFSKNVVDGWVASQTHRENILRPEFSEVGFAIVNGVLNGEETTLVVQMFARPAQAQIAQVEVENSPSQPQVLAKSQTESRGNTLPFSFTTTLIFIAFLIVLLGLDFYYAKRLNILRVHGKSLAHLIFLSSLIVGLFFFLSKGSIL